ncbi:MAG: 3-hydroxyacyl-CoA dehydrogenase NAD-binding domain-containing protein [Vicinamibacterales bacterium]
MDIRTIGVVGAGTMGNGIAQVFAQAGFTVTLVDVAQPMLDRARTTIDKSLARFVDKGKLTATDRDATLSRLGTSTALDALAPVDYVVEAIVENADVKRDVFKRLDAITRPEIILSTNTSSISITLIGAATTRPDKVLGMHFMNPVPLMTLVELIRGQATSDESMQAAFSLCVKLGKTGVEAADYPGFIANRILMPMLNEAFFAVMEGVGTPEAIDAVMKGGMNHPMGPLTLADFIGLDVCLAILNVLHEGIGYPKYPAVPAPAADGGRRPSRSQERPRLLHLRLTPLNRSIPPHQCCRLVQRRRPTPKVRRASNDELIGRQCVISRVARHNPRRSVLGEKGSALVEVAVVSPVLLLMVFGIVQFGVVMHTNVTLNDAVRVGSRNLALMRGNADPCAATATKVRNAAQGFTTANISMTVTVNSTNYGPSATPSCAGQGATMTSGADASVQATYPCSAIIYGINFIPGCTLRARTTVRVE